MIIGSSQAIEGAQQAVKNAGKLPSSPAELQKPDTIKLIGNGGSCQAVKAVKAGKWFAAYVLPEKSSGEKATELGIKAANGEDVPSSFNTNELQNPMGTRDVLDRRTSRRSTATDAAGRSLSEQTVNEQGPSGGGRPLLEVRKVSKRFGGVQAVVDADLVVAHESVHGLVGENGAGKSTLSKVIAGVHEPDGGEVLVEGGQVRFHSPRDALAAGIATIAQEIALVPRATVEENVLLGIEPHVAGLAQSRGAAPALQPAERAVGLPPAAARARSARCGRPTSRRSRSCGRSPATRG